MAATEYTAEITQVIYEAEITGNVTVNTGMGVISSVNGKTGTVILDTDDIAEGETNEYYTDAKAITALAPHTSDTDIHTTAIEKQALTDADSALQSAITSEAATRAAADALIVSNANAAYEPKDTGIQEHMADTDIHVTTGNKSYWDSKSDGDHLHPGVYEEAFVILDGSKLPEMSAAKRGGVPATGTPSGKFLKDDGTWAAPSVPAGSVAWGAITGDITNQTDLDDALAGKSNIGHNHDGDYEPVDDTILRQADLAGSGTALTPSKSDHNHTGTYEPADATILKDADIGVTVSAQVHNHDTAYEAKNSNIQAHIATTTGNPHNVTKANVGLGNCDNTSDANKPVSTAQATAIGLKADKTTTVNGHALDANVTVTKGDVGLGNCDNTSDASKPISTATQTALEGKQAAITTIANVTLTSGSWSLVSGLYNYVYSNVAITATKSVTAIPQNASIATVKTAEVLPRTLSASGSVTFYSTNAPGGDIIVDLILTEVQ